MSDAIHAAFSARLARFLAGVRAWTEAATHRQDYRLSVFGGPPWTATDPEERDGADNERADRLRRAVAATGRTWQESVRWPGSGPPRGSMDLITCLEVAEAGADEVVREVVREVRIIVAGLCPECASEVETDPEVAARWPWPRPWHSPAAVALDCLLTLAAASSDIVVDTGHTAEWSWLTDAEVVESARWVRERWPDRKHGAELGGIMATALPDPSDPDVPGGRVWGYRQGPTEGAAVVGFALVWRAWRRTGHGAAHLAWRWFGGVAEEGRSILAPDVQRAANAVQDDEKAAGDAAARDPEAAGKLAAEVRAALPDLLRAVELDGGAPPADPERFEVGEDGKRRLWWDAALARYLGNVGGFGVELGRALLSGAADRWWQANGAPTHEAPGTVRRLRGDLWHLWLADRDPAGIPGALYNLALVLWRDRVRVRLEALRAARMAEQKDGQLLLPARVVEVLATYHDPRGRMGVMDDGRHGLFRGGKLVVPMAELPPCPVVEPAAFHLAASRGAAKLGTTLGLRTILFEAGKLWQQSRGGHPDFRVVDYSEGGTEAMLAEVLEPYGVKVTKPGIQALREILIAQSCLPCTDANGKRIGTLIALDADAWRRGGGPGRRSSLRWTGGTMLHPFRVKKEDERDRFLSPLDRYPDLLDTRQPQDAAGQYALWLRFMAHAGRASRELVEEGGWLLLPDQWLALADAAGLRPAITGDVVASWCRETGTGPAHLERDGDRYRLTETAHAGAIAWLTQRGKQGSDAAAGKPPKRGRTKKRNV